VSSPDYCLGLIGRTTAKQSPAATEEKSALGNSLQGNGVPRGRLEDFFERDHPILTLARRPNGPQELSPESIRTNAMFFFDSCCGEKECVTVSARFFSFQSGGASARFQGMRGGRGF
jgi:hypothetical protein